MIKAADSKIRTALIFSYDVPSVEAQRAAGATSMPWMRSITASDVRRQHAAGMQVWCWTARSATQYRRAVELGVDGIVVDDPRTARRWLDKNISADGRLLRADRRR
jgi:glycerophosphoryl diester phosphodiesterase